MIHMADRNPPWNTRPEPEIRSYLHGYKEDRIEERNTIQISHEEHEGTKNGNNEDLTRGYEDAKKGNMDVWESTVRYQDPNPEIRSIYMDIQDGQGRGTKQQIQISHEGTKLGKKENLMRRHKE